MFGKKLSATGLALGAFVGSNAMAVEYGSVVSRTAVYQQVDVATRQCDDQGMHCKAVSRPQTKLIGFDVVYDYNGQRYNARMPNDPGDRIALDVSVAPSVSQRVDSSPTQSLPAASGAPADTRAEFGSAPQAGDRSRAPVPAYPESDPPDFYAPAPVTTYAYPYANLYVYPGVIVAAPPVVVTPGIGIGFGYWGGYGRRHWH